mgnify:CR=1 FL=1
MKKKTVAAMLVMCMALSATACGGSDTKETKTETTQDTGDKKDSASSDKKTSDFGSQTWCLFLMFQKYVNDWRI